MGNFVRLGANGIASNTHLKQIGGYSVIDLIVSESGVLTLSVGQRSLWVSLPSAERREHLRDEGDPTGALRCDPGAVPVLH